MLLNIMEIYVLYMNENHLQVKYHFDDYMQD